MTFRVGRVTADTLVLLLGKTETWTPLPWGALEGIPGAWVLIGSAHSADSRAGGVDQYLKRYVIGPLSRRSRWCLSALAWPRSTGTAQHAPGLRPPDQKV